MDFFSTHHQRPRRSDDVTLLSDAVLYAAPMGLILQGPLLAEDDFTIETVRLYHKLYQNTQIIVSTWDDEDVAQVRRIRDAGACVVLSKKPDYAGISNINFQIASARAGVEKALELGCAYALKSRTDQRMYAPNVKEFLFSLLRMFPLANEGGIQRERLVAAALNTFKYRLYGISDMLLFGTTADMLLYWSPEYDMRLFAEIDEAHRRSVLDFCKCRLCEVFLSTEFLRKVGHEPDFTLADSWLVYAQRFCVADTESFDLFWPKYTEMEHRWLRYAPHDYEELTFREWLILYAALENKAVIPEDRLLPGGRK